MAQYLMSWRCPYCQQTASITDENLSDHTHDFNKRNRIGTLGLRTRVIVCPNEHCREFTIDASLYEIHFVSGSGMQFKGEPILTWRMKPNSFARQFPDYIPRAIRQDYEEACLIRDLSPKASATLSRRCLQGAIRDFWSIQKGRLIDEINELHEQVDAISWKAIDSVRSIGNIGAHMEKDINLLIDVDADEADLLIQLIEVVLEEWYIRRHEREARMQKVIAVAAAKAASKTPNAS